MSNATSQASGGVTYGGDVVGAPTVSWGGAGMSAWTIAAIAGAVLAACVAVYFALRRKGK